MKTDGDQRRLQCFETHTETKKYPKYKETDFDSKVISISKHFAPTIDGRKEV